MEATLEQARRMGAPRALALCHCFAGALEFQNGAWEEAEKVLHAAIRLYRELGAASGEALSRQRLGVLLTAQGRLTEAEAVLQEGIGVAEGALMRAHCLTRLYAALARNRLAAGDVQAAAQALDLGLTMSDRHGHCTTCNALLLPVAVSVRIGEGRLDEAGHFARRLDEAAARYGSRVWLAMAQQSQGELEMAHGNLDAAIAHYQAAYTNFEGAHYAFEALRCLEALAFLHQQHQDWPQVTAIQQAAAQIARRLGVESRA